MIRLSTLGSLDLRGADGAALDALIPQKKRVALLVYLAAERPGEMHRRDRLLLLFWPELDDRRARDALNQSLHVLRQSLGPACIVSRGAEEVGVDSRELWCDAVEFQRALDAGRPDEALALYRGEFLHAFHARASHDFEEWQRLERERLQGRAAQAARDLAEQHERSRNYTVAVEWARRALQLTGLDERALRRLMVLRDQAGDRAGAIREYDEFVERLASELGQPPSPETRELAERLRSGEPKYSPIVGPSLAVPHRGGQSAGPRAVVPPSPADGRRPSPERESVAVVTPQPGYVSPMPALDGASAEGVAGAPRIEGYRVLREIDRGGAAIVYLAREDKHGRTVAIKVLKPELAESIQAERFLREIAIIAHLSHPHVLPLLDSGRSGSHLYFIAPYVTGESLRRRIDAVPACQLPVEESMRIAREVALALDYAHRRGIVHRDVKPENVLLSEGQAIVADFGIARAMTLADDARMTFARMAIGTPAYMSPEQCDGDSEVDARSDIYSLGCVLYEMLAGHPPFRGTPSQVIAQHVAAPVPSMREACPLIPYALERVVLRALAKDPADRYATAAELATAIEDVTQRGARWLDAWRAVRRTAWVRSTIAVLIVAAVVIGARWSLDPAPSPTDAPPDLSRIAVLYFDDLSPGGDQGHIAAGLTEDLIDGLSQLAVLRVASPIAVRQFRGGSESLDSVVRALGVGTVVSGTLARSDSMLRLTVRLTDARDAYQMQSRTFEYPLRDLFELQDELGVQVTDFLRQRLGKEIRLREQRIGTQSVYAWELVQRAEDLAEQGAIAVREERRADALRTFARADTMFARAASIDAAWSAPLIGRGWIALSLAFLSPHPGSWTASGTTTRSGISREWIGRAIGYADTALGAAAMDPNALTLRGAALWHLAALANGPGLDTLLARGERDLHTALQYRPNLAPAWSFLALTYSVQARFDDAADAAVAALDADAFLVNREQILATLISASLHAERFAEAEEWCRFARTRHATDPRFVNCELMLIGWRGDQPADVDVGWSLLSAIERDTLATTDLLWAYRRLLIAAAAARAGMSDSARAVLERTRRERTARPGRIEMPIEEAWVLTLLRDYEGAVNRLMAYLDRNPEARHHVLRSPQFRDLRIHPRFRSLLRADRSPAASTGG